LIVLVHSGICDATMWDGFDVPGATRHEIRGFGQTPMPRTGTVSNADDLAETMGNQPAALVGASYGGWVCIQLAMTRPELVTDLVLLGAPLPDHEWSAEMEEVRREEERLVEEEGDLHAGAVLMADFWLEAPEPRDRVIEMQKRAYEMQLGSEAELDEPDSIDLSKITARTLVGVGELDKPDFHAIADRLARGIPNAQSVVIPGAGHLPSLERPEATASVICRFLSI
jgi:pimeloyl-ACP methyl ester carboxylesterase